MKSLKIIINADDCGINESVDKEIERFIQMGKITSTTVMANMDDLKGAVRLFSLYRDMISFGVHINLTDGEPLTYSQLLLDYGYYKEVNGKILLNGYPFIHKILPRSVQKEILVECLAQINQVRDAGINISHIDSHHLMHTSLSMRYITPQILNDSGVKKMRRARNYMPAKGINFYVRQLWFQYMKNKVHGLKSTNYMESFLAFIKLENQKLRMSGSLELMVHPGGNNKEEQQMMLAMDFATIPNIQLINYNQL